MKHIKHFFIFITLCFLFSCGTVKRSFLTNEYDNHMYNLFEGYFTEYQLDSICRVDMIERDISKWYVIPLYDYETKENVSQYMYIMSLGEYECIYRVQPLDDGRYKITKRVTE